MFRFLISLCLVAVLFEGAFAADAIRDSVVQIHFTRRGPDFYRPWTKASPSNGTGSGVVIEGNRILTNAHVVRYASQLFVQLKKGGDKLPAKAIAVAPRIDLALVELEDPNGLDGIDPLPLSDDIPAVKSTVNVYGYPMGGDDISVTEGIVSRIEHTSYYYDGEGLRIQIDAALNPGNSGGPAIKDGKVVGLVFSGIQKAENIGYIIPAEEIEVFLSDFADGTFDGKPRMFQEFATLENSALRDFLKVPKNESGVVLGKPYLEENYPLQRWDVITHIGSHNIDNEGYVDLNEDLRIRFQYYVPKLYENDKIQLTVWRDGKSDQVLVPVSPVRQRLMPELIVEYPRYFIYGPLVFSAATEELASALSSSRKWVAYLSYTENPLLNRRYDKPAFEGEEIVLICSRMFPHRISKGYSDPALCVVTHVNGEPAKSLRQFAEMLRNSKDEFIRFRLAGRAESLVFRRSEIEASTEEILTDEGIRYQCSPDLRDVWD